MIRFHQEINLNDFEPLSEPQRSAARCAINVSPTGQVTLNSHFMRELKKYTNSMSFAFYSKKSDKSILLLFLSNTPNYTFSAKGTRKDTDFSRSLVRAGISLPARYLVSWEPAQQIWVCELASNSRDADPLSAVLPPKKPTGRRKPT